MQAEHLRTLCRGHTEVQGAGKAEEAEEGSWEMIEEVNNSSLLSYGDIRARARAFLKTTPFSFTMGYTSIVKQRGELNLQSTASNVENNCIVSTRY